MALLEGEFHNAGEFVASLSFEGIKTSGYADELAKAISM